MEIRALAPADYPAARAIWNEVVEEGVSFPGEQPLSEQEAARLFASQTAARGLFVDGALRGGYILHPNNEGRCGHIANASYAVDARYRGSGYGRALVSDCIEQAKAHGFKGLQFNAVVASNRRAVSLYLSLGFRVVGTVPGGFRMPGGQYEDTMILLLKW